VKRFLSNCTETLALTDDEMEIIRDCATPLSPRDRGEFLREVADELQKCEQFGPGLVSRICARLQRSYLSQRVDSGSC
jgi:hypothetical protein